MGYKPGAKARACGSIRQEQGQSRGQNDPGWASSMLPHFLNNGQVPCCLILTLGAGPTTPYALHPDSTYKLCIGHNNTGGRIAIMLRDSPLIGQRFHVIKVELKFYILST